MEEELNIKVGLLSIEEKDLLVGQQFAADMYFNPIQDNDNNWVISQEEINACVDNAFNWLCSVPLISYVPKVIKLKYPIKKVDTDLNEI